MNVILAKKLAGLCAVILLLGVMLASVPAAKGAPVFAATQAETTQAPVAEPPYKGDGSKYTYITTDERDRQWEEDIVYLADTFLHYLHGHPKLIDQKCLVIRADSDTVGEGKWTNANLYDPALRDEFIRHINALILRIHDSSDAELLFGCSEAAALLGDAHSGISLSMDERFPLGVVQFYAKDVPEAYIVAAPKGYEDLLLCRLDAINGVTVSEIITKAAKVIPHENLYLVQNELFYSSNSKARPCPMLGCDLLRYIGVLGEENTAEFTITEESGATRKIVLSSYPKDSLPELASYPSPSDTDPSISLNLIDSDPEASGWYRIIDDGKALYIRISSCVSDTKTIVRKAVKAAAAEDALETVIVDFRGNRGGTSEASKTLVSAINSLDVSGGKYVLIDGGVCSSTIIFSVYLKRYCEGVMLVGTPAGEPTNETFETQGYTSPNQKLKFSMARLKQFYMWPGYDEVALMPDILIGQSLEDYRNDVDSVLKYVLRDGQQTKSSPASEETSVLEPPYKGDGSRYTYITTDERDREWEEDIVYLADTYLHYLNGHPKLIDRQCLVIRADSDTVGKASMTRESLYDPALRDEFIRHINALILRIHESSDSELLYGCSEAVALLGDAHSNVYLPQDEMFPLGLVLLYAEDVPEAYIFAAPQGDEDLLLCRLDAINGVSVSDIISRAAKVIPHENLYLVQYFLFYDTYSKVLPCLMLNCDLLRYLGVLGEENAAEFTITEETGATRKIALSSCQKDLLPEFASYAPPSDTDPSVSLHLRDSDREASGWYRFIDDGKALYIRISSCENDSGKIVSEAVEAATAEDGLEKVIVDFRGNSGGTNAASETIVTAIDALDVSSGKYVLIDGGVCSATVSFAVYIKRYCNDVVLVGTPAGEPANETFQTSQFTLPNHKLLFLMSILKQFYTWPGYDEDALMPDILIGQSPEDYRNGIDSVLKYVLSEDAR